MDEKRLFMYVMLEYLVGTNLMLFDHHMYREWDKALLEIARDSRYSSKMFEGLDNFRAGYSNYTDILINGKGPGFAFVVILVGILHGFRFDCNNYDNFCCIVDDLDDVSIKKDYEIKEVESFVNNWRFKEVMSNTCYKDMNNYRNYIKKAISDLDIKMIETLYYMLYRTMLQTEVDCKYASKVLDDRVGALLDGKREEPFYSNILLFGDDRYFYINRKLNEVEDNYDLKKEMFSFICKLEKGLFDEINTSCEKDSFITCMDIVFDSDSYHEMISKLESLVKASMLYVNGEKEEYLDLIRNLSSDSHKEIYCGEVVSYPKNTMNRINKPKRIIDRMRYLYSRIDNSISYAFMDKIHSEEKSFLDFKTSFDKQKEEINKPVEKVKNKFGERLRWFFK